MLNLKILSKTVKFMKEGKSLALVTVLDLGGSSPGQAGSQMIVLENGESYGTIGGGILERKVIDKALESLDRKEDVEAEIRLSEEDIGMTCGGEVGILIQIYLPNPRLVIVGAGHVGKALYDVMSLLDFDIIVLDDREEFANQKRFPEARVICADVVEELTRMDLDKKSYLVIATRGHSHDEDALKAVIDRDVKYIGVIGSSNKVKKMNENLLKAGVEKEKIDFIFSPIGLDIANKKPSEIAISIAAEILAIKNNRDVKKLKECLKVSKGGKYV